MQTNAIDAQEIAKHPAVAHARPWRDHINIDLRGHPSYRAGRPTFKAEIKTRIRLHGTRLTIERSSGATSAEWEDNLRSLVTWLCSRGVQVHVQSSAKAVRFLAIAERHMAEGQERILRQRTLIARLARHGHSTAKAEEFLQLLQQLQQQNIARRDRLRAEVELDSEVESAA